MLTAIASFASFTAVLAESLAAIGLSTIAPALVATLGKQLKCAFESYAADSQATDRNKALEPVRQGLQALNKMITPHKDGLPVDTVLDVIGSVMESMIKGSESIEAIDLLVPKTADLDATFEFHANEQYEGEGQVGGMVSMFTIKAGMSALYSCESSNKVSLKLHFESVPVDLRCRRADLDLLKLALVSALTQKKITVSDADTQAILAVKDLAKIKDATTFVSGLSDPAPATALATVKTRLGIPTA